MAMGEGLAASSLSYTFAAIFLKQIHAAQNAGNANLKIPLYLLVIYLFKLRTFDVGKLLGIC